MCSDTREIRGNVVPCGRCEECLRQKRWVYSARMAAEIFTAPRSWFVTLTLRKNMTDAVGYRLVQRWLKRVRKGMSDPIRYACVAEHGSQATRRLHYHVVLHGGQSLTQRSIRSRWRGGISEATEIRSGDAANAARYSSKAARYTAKGNRFRFSQGYGSRALQKVYENEILQAVLDQWPDARLRVGGVNMPRRLLPTRPFRSVFDADQHHAWTEAKMTTAKGQTRGARAKAPSAEVWLPWSERGGSEAEGEGSPLTDNEVEGEALS